MVYLGPLLPRHDLLTECEEMGGPAYVHRTIAGVTICGRCGHAALLHHLPRGSSGKYHTPQAGEPPLKTTTNYDRRSGCRCDECRASEV